MDNLYQLRRDRKISGSTPEVRAAIDLLHQFTVIDTAMGASTLASSVEKLPAELSQESIYEALTLVLDGSEYQLIGICAENYAEGTLALQQYLAAFASLFWAIVDGHIIYAVSLFGNHHFKNDPYATAALPC